MKKIPLLLVPGLLLALFTTGCESGDIVARTQEKSAAYATLKPWEKKYIGRGDISVGFTPDMVYMAIGSATTVKHDPTSGSANTELWIYQNFYLPTDARHYPSSTSYNLDAPFQPMKPVGAINDPSTNGFYTAPSGASGIGNGNFSISRTGGPQGGSLEPADLKMYTLYVLFVEGKVVKFGVKAN